MPRQPTGRPNGRPQKPIDLKQVEKLSAMMSTDQEIADFFSVSVDTLTRREGFAEAKAKGQSEGKRSLRSSMFAAALAGNSRIQTWLSMQYLGHRNRTETELSGPDRGPINVNLTKLTDDQLAQLEQLVSAVTQPDPDPGGEVA